LRQFTLTFVADEESVTEYVAVDPALTVADVVVNDGGVPPPESISNCSRFDVPPPGSGFCALIDFTPAAATWALVTCAVSWVVLTNCVLRAVVPQYTVEYEVKPDPLTISANPGPPATANAGDNELNTGTGSKPITVYVAVLIELCP
jgi:hypothetical protein